MSNSEVARMGPGEIHLPGSGREGVVFHDAGEVIPDNAVLKILEGYSVSKT